MNFTDAYLAPSAGLPNALKGFSLLSGSAYAPGGDHSFEVCVAYLVEHFHYQMREHLTAARSIREALGYCQNEAQRSQVLWEAREHIHEAWHKRLQARAARLNFELDI